MVVIPEEYSFYRQWAELFKVLAHPTRLAIIASLAQGTKCVNDVCDVLHIAQPNISQHLAVLRNEGIVNYTEEGKKRCYYLENPDLVQGLLVVLSSDLAAHRPRGV
jgi:ArsR family transcriptional regulator